MTKTHNKLTHSASPENKVMVFDKLFYKRSYLKLSKLNWFGLYGYNYI